VALRRCTGCGYEEFSEHPTLCGRQVGMPKWDADHGVLLRGPEPFECTGTLITLEEWGAAQAAYRLNGIDGFRDLLNAVSVHKGWGAWSCISTTD
jgi:hypothetical protein